MENKETRSITISNVGFWTNKDSWEKKIQHIFIYSYWQESIQVVIELCRLCNDVIDTGTGIKHSLEKHNIMLSQPEPIKKRKEVL